MTVKKYIGQITDTEVFISAMEDLRYKNRDNHYSEYDILKSCGLIRQLILDSGKSLYTKVNRGYNLKLVFRVRKGINEQIDGDSWYKCVHTDGGEYVELRFDEFVKLVVLKSGIYEFTVKEVIRHACHVLGGIHSGEPQDAKDAYFKDLKGLLNLESIFKFIAMQSICTVVIDALKPLEEAIKNTPKGVD